MKRIFQIIGILTLLVGSFMYTEEVSTTARLSDTLLTEIQDRAQDYQIASVPAIIKDNTIIPGKCGQEVDIQKSYDKMRQIGYFNSKLLVYKKSLLQDPLKDHTDKYIISANQKEKQISLLFKVQNNSDINPILKVLNKNNLKGTFYINSWYLENNHNKVIELIEKGHTIGNLSADENYQDSDFIWMKTIITNSGSQKYNYCYAATQNAATLKVCHLQNSYTIKPTAIISQRPFINVKQNLKPGALISLELTDELNTEIENIVNYIISKGYKLKSLESILEE